MEIHALISLESLPNHLRQYVNSLFIHRSHIYLIALDSFLNVYKLALFTLPIRLRSGEILSSEISNAILKEETVRYHCGLGMQGC